jgi:Tfp pilus assembly protein PilO
VKKSRRQIVNRILEAVAIALVVINIGVYFGLYAPLESKLESAEREHERLRQTVRDQEARLEILKKYQSGFPQLDKGLSDFMTNRTPSRREAYSTAAHLVHKIADAAGVKVEMMGYRLNPPEHNEPLEQLDLDINLDGQYANLVKFGHALETANNFIVVREFNFTPNGDNQPVSLRLGAEFFVTP